MCVSDQPVNQSCVRFLVQILALFLSGLVQCGMMGYVVQNFFAALKIPLPVPPFHDLSLDTSPGVADHLTDIAFDTELTTQVTNNVSFFPT